MLRLAAAFVVAASSATLLSVAAHNRAQSRAGDLECTAEKCCAEFIEVRDNEEFVGCFEKYDPAVIAGFDLQEMANNKFKRSLVKVIEEENESCRGGMRVCVSERPRCELDADCGAGHVCKSEKKKGSSRKFCTGGLGSSCFLKYGGLGRLVFNQGSSWDQCDADLKCATAPGTYSGLCCPGKLTLNADGAYQCA